jgi:hypothetical protein
MPPESGTGNPSGNNGNNTGDAGRSPAQRDSDVVGEMRNFIRTLQDNNTSGNKEREILDKNFKLRRKNAELADRVAQLEAQRPKDGTVVLSKEDAAEYDAFKKLNLKAADLQTIVKEHGELKLKVAERDAEELYVDVADAMGFDNLPAFMRFMEREKLHVEFKDVQERDEDSGKMVTVKVPMVRPKADDKAQLEPLAGYVEREVPEFIDIFQMAPDEEGGEEDSVAAGERAGGRGDSFQRQAQRFGEGDREARRQAGLSPRSGIAMPVTRNARPTSGASRADKQQREALEEKRNNPAYASL